jgi:outer membrane murein-binding lipoprotein Lpp
VEFEDVADELYRLPPEEFIPARKEREAEARAAGDRGLAQDIAGLAKPSTAAWVCNLLAHEQPDEVAQLVELGGLLREAQENLAGDELRALDVQRRQLVAALTRQARALAYRQGHSVTTTVAGQVEDTLRAALADPDAGEALLAGRLTTALSYSGLGTGERPDLRVVPPARRERPVQPERPARKRAAGRDDGAAGRRERERAEAERRAAEERRRRQLEEARAAADEAATAADEAAAAEEGERARVDELRGREEELEARIEELTEQLNRTRDECTAVHHDRSRAERRHQAASRRAADAARARDRAQQRLEELRRG